MVDGLQRSAGTVSGMVGVVDLVTVFGGRRCRLERGGLHLPYLLQMGRGLLLVVVLVALWFVVRVWGGAAALFRHRP